MDMLDDVIPLEQAVDTIKRKQLLRRITQRLYSLSQYNNYCSNCSRPEKRFHHEVNDSFEAKRPYIYPEKGYSYDVRFAHSFCQQELPLQMSSFYAVHCINGKKHGFGHVMFGAPFEDYVFTTSWDHDVPSGRGFIYNQKTGSVIGRVMNHTKVELFCEDGIHPEWAILDEDDGRRWEGMCLDGTTCGLGEYYDEDNHLLYRGMSILGKWEGFGTTFYPLYSNEEQIDTKGDWCHGQLIGEYCVYDRYGNVCSEGYQIDGQQVTDTIVLRSLSQLNCYLRHVVIGDNALNTIRTLNLDALRYLETLEVGNRSCRQCQTVIISHLSLLRTIQIGDYSFTQYDTSLDLLLSESKSILDAKKSLHMENLHSLEEITIGNGSFSDFSQIKITDMSVLQVLTFGSCCFFYTESLQLCNLLLLSTVTLESFSFYHGNSVELHGKHGGEN